MRTRSLLRAALDIRRPSPYLRPPPSFLLPRQAYLHPRTLSTQSQNTRPEIPPAQPYESEAGFRDPAVTEQQHATNPPPPSPSSSLHAQEPWTPPFTAAPSADVNSTPTTASSTSTTSPPPPTQSPLVLSKSLQTLLPHLTSQKPHYLTAHIHRFPYLLTAGDTLRLPFHMHGVYPGDILRLNRASILGSRDFTLKAGKDSPTAEYYDGKRISGVHAGVPAYLDERLFECRARVLGVDSGPMVVEIKTKRRQRKKKHVTSKHKHTVLRVMEIRVRSLEELKGMGMPLVLE